MAQALLVVNLGCELLYVVQQRLRAQRLPPDTANTVLTDILEVLFNEKLIRELEDAPQLGKHNHVRQLMEDIANVSIMRLDAFSMTKLWELMVMVFKWQISVTKPNELFILTERHLQGVIQLVPDQPVISKIMRFYHKIYKMGKDTHEKCILMMRNAILIWLQDFNVRVSLLLRLGLQRNDGSFYMTNNPDEKMLKILQNVGESIYLYEDADDDLPRDGRNLNTNTSEVSFLVQDILGDSKDTIKNTGSFDLRFLQKDKGKLDCKQRSHSVCEFEIKTSENVKSKPDIENLNETSASTSTLHDDLLMLLDGDTSV
ncbi:organic solute carrier partner 1 [Arctopsyche grandis]|uniref:organic solute carrier partner 1 n=1 Tax=Arctopsyche grandis TaxID=121162 RepID=UPI00406D8E00